MAQSIGDLNVNSRVFTRHEDDFLAWAKRHDVEEDDNEIKKYLKRQRAKLGIKECHLLPKRHQTAPKVAKEVKK